MSTDGQRLLPIRRAASNGELEPLTTTTYKGHNSMKPLGVHPPMARDKGGWNVAPAPDGRGTPTPPPPTPPHRKRGFLWFLLALIIVNWASVFLVGAHGPQRVTVPFNPYFLNAVKAHRVVAIDTKGDTVQGTFTAAVRYPANAPAAQRTKLFATEVPTFWSNDQLSDLLRADDVRINATSPDAGGSVLISLLFGFGPTLLFVAFFVFAARRAAAMAGKGGLAGLGMFGRSQARRIDPQTIRVTFDDVAGIDDAKQELTEVVDFLRDPEPYTRLGGRPPHGVLLSGAPGTGKTLLARAVAGEAHAAFFSISASEFIEAIVGVGAARVRDLFAKAREAAPAIVFIDELDSVGRSRGGSNAFGGNDEREQTLNQILTELDGFEGSEAVIVLAATNRPDVLDPALLRPGRFDRQVVVQAPDRPGRRKILDVHTREMPLAPDVDLDAIAASTPGMVGADLANLANEAALLAARRKHHRVAQADFTDSLEKILLGAKRGLILSEEDRKRTAVHESGHALVGMLTPGADPVRKISIIPRGAALGVTLSAPDEDHVSYTRDELIAKLKVAAGGRVAEEITYGEITTGAESDIQQITQIARQMVGRWGMSDAIGLLTVLPPEAQGPLLPGSETSQATQNLVDSEVKRIVDAAHEDVSVLLRDHEAQLAALAAAVLAAETLDERDAYAAAGVEHDVMATA